MFCKHILNLSIKTFYTAFMNSYSLSNENTLDEQSGVQVLKDIIYSNLMNIQFIVFFFEYCHRSTYTALMNNLESKYLKTFLQQFDEHPVYCLLL